MNSFNVLYLGFGELNKCFVVISLIGKMVNIGDDILIMYLNDFSIFKKLIIGEVVLIEYKGKECFSFKNIVKMIFVINKLLSI